MEALGRFLFEKEIRRTISKEYIDRAFTKFKNRIRDIGLNPELWNSYQLLDDNGAKICPPPFKWEVFMAEDVLAVSGLGTCQSSTSLRH